MPRGVYLRPSPEERFWSKVDQTGDGCWPFMGSTDRDGYGRFGIDGRTRGAHNVALEFHLGRALRPGEQGNHDCDNPPFVRVGPGHVKLGNQPSNMRDKVARGRQSHVGPKNHARVGPRNPVRGEAHRCAKLTPAAVREIRDSQQTLATLSKRFGVSINQVSLVKRGRSWRHVA